MDSSFAWRELSLLQGLGCRVSHGEALYAGPLDVAIQCLQFTGDRVIEQVMARPVF